MGFFSSLDELCLWLDCRFHRWLQIQSYNRVPSSRLFVPLTCFNRVQASRLFVPLTCFIHKHMKWSILLFLLTTCPIFPLNIICYLLLKKNYLIIYSYIFVQRECANVNWYNIKQRPRKRISWSLLKLTYYLTMIVLLLYHKICSIGFIVLNDANIVVSIAQIINLYWFVII